ncbi:MAG: fasciclin domain-containing protein [Paludibacter sp.]
MTKTKHLTLIALLLLLFFGCRKDDALKNIYQRPAWLAGKLYTQILTKPELSTFADLLHVAGYDTILDISGSYTVFAPTNDAFTAYFQSNSKYKSVAELPKAEALRLVKYHLVQDAWSKKQLQSLDIYGWIDTLDLTNNLPKGYKRATLLLEKNQKYGVKYSPYKRQNSTLYRTDIIDTTLTPWNRRVFTDSRKYAPIFYKQYFDIYKLSTSDYSFYYNRPFDSPSDMYYSNAKIVSDEIFAENGFIYEVDKVVEPLKNGMEILEDKTTSNSYSEYLDLVNQFAEMDYNQTETNKQPGADQGLKVDSLFNLRYRF